MTNTNKGTINPLSQMRQRSMDHASRWDHLQPAQMAKLFLDAEVGDLDEAWAKLIKCEAQARVLDIPQWKPSMFMNVARREYHTYFPMLMEMNSTEFQCISCRFCFLTLTINNNVVFMFHGFCQHFHLFLQLLCTCISHQLKSHIIIL